MAQRYKGLGILDMAYDHLLVAERLAPDDAATQDGLARLWRSWGLEELGLGAAYRAVRYAPTSPQAHNTLGTMLQTLERLPESRQAYERGLELDPTAGYILNNLCYLSFVEGNFQSAIETCRAALRFDPTLAEAHTNLALVYYATRDDDLAWRELQSAGAEWTAMYNLGMAHMARGDHLDAAEAFAEASRANPHWAAPRHRATQALSRASDRPRGR